MDLFDQAMQHGEALATNGYLLQRVEELTSQLADRDAEIATLRARVGEFSRFLLSNRKFESAWILWKVPTPPDTGEEG